MQHGQHPQTRLGRHQAIEADGDAPLTQRLQLLALGLVVQFDAHLRAGAVESRQHARNHIEHTRAKNAHIQLARQALARTARALTCPLGQREDVGHFFQQRLAGRRQLHTLGRTYEQVGAQLFFNAANLPRQRRLRHVQAGSSPPEMQLLRQRQKVLHLPQVHSGPLPTQYPEGI